jgi:signal transduction histidine kinase
LHSVSLIVIQAQAAQHSRDEGATGQQALTEMRRLLGLLRRPRTPGGHGAPGRTGFAGGPEPLPPGVDLSAYRIVQEALTNALKHDRRSSQCLDLETH